jgi:hypothetical protein
VVSLSDPVLKRLKIRATSLANNRSQLTITTEIAHRSNSVIIRKIALRLDRAIRKIALRSDRAIRKIALGLDRGIKKIALGSDRAIRKIALGSERGIRKITHGSDSAGSATPQRVHPQGPPEEAGGQYELQLFTKDPIARPSI